jgi:hypothetical protein
MDTMDTPEIRKALEEVPSEVLTATTDLTASFSAPLSRRRLLLGAAAGTVGIAGAGVAAAALLNAHAVRAEVASGGSTLTEFFSILATGEALFVTFYEQGVKNHDRLGINGSALNSLEAILAEEQMHLRFALSQGGKPATTHFSFPHGQETFEDREVFLETQQLGEDLTNGALLAWIKDMSSMGMTRLAEVGGQLMQVEGGHRVIGRVIMGAEPFPNWGFGPVVLDHFTQVPAAVKAAGFLSPRPGNDFEFHPVRPSFPGVIHTTPGEL